MLLKCDDNHKHHCAQTQIDICDVRVQRDCKGYSPAIVFNLVKLCLHNFNILLHYLHQPNFLMTHYFLPFQISTLDSLLTIRTYLLFRIDVVFIEQYISCYASFTSSFLHDTCNSVVGGVYLFYHLLIKKSIIWSDFNMDSDDWQLLQIGLGLFFLQVGGRK